MGMSVWGSGAIVSSFALGHDAVAVRVPLGDELEKLVRASPG